MAEPHVVQELCFEVDFETSELAWSEQERVNAFAQGPALRIVEETFAEALHEGEVLRLEALELDLGEVDPAELEEEWERRLRRALQEALAEHRARHMLALGEATGGAGEAAVAWSTVEQAELHALLHFLQHGRWPWYRAPDTDLQALAVRVAGHSGVALAQGLRTLAAVPGAEALLAARLARQFPAAWLQPLERQLIGGPASPDAIAQATAPWPTRRAQAQQRLQAALRGVPADGVTREPLPALPSSADAPGGAPRNDAPTQRRARQPDTELRAQLRRLKALLVDDAPTLSDEDLAELLALWQRLARDDAEGLRQCLQTLGRQARVRRRIAWLWPEALLAHLPALWLNEAGGRRWQQSLRRHAGAGGSADRRSAWEALLRELWAGDAPRLAMPEAESTPEEAAAERAALPRGAGSWIRQRVLAATATRQELAQWLSAWLPAEHADALAALLFDPLPQAWLTGVGGGVGAPDTGLRVPPPPDIAQRVQWCLQALADAGEGAVDAHALVRGWWRALAVQQRRSPAQLLQALGGMTADAYAVPRVPPEAPVAQAPADATQPADAARRAAWRRWLPAEADVDAQGHAQAHTDTDTDTDGIVAPPSGAAASAQHVRAGADAALRNAAWHLSQALRDGGDWQGVEAAWSLLHRDAREPLATWLRQVAASAAVRRRLALRLPDALWPELLGLFVAPAVAARWDARWQALARRAPPGIGAARRLAALRARALAALLWAQAADRPEGTDIADTTIDVAWQRLESAWSGGDWRDGSFDADWQVVWRAQPARLRRRLLEAGAAPRVRWQWVAGFTPVQWAQLLALLAPAGSALSRRLARGVARAVEAPAGSIERERWLDHALAAAASRPAEVTDRARSGPVGDPSRDATSASRRRAVVAQVEFAAAQRAGALSAALQADDPAALAAAWRSLQAAAPAVARQALRRWADEPTQLARLAARLTRERRRALLGWWLPDAAQQQVESAFASLQSLLAEGRAPQPTDEGAAALAESLLAVLLWWPSVDAEAVIGHLLEHAGWQLGLAVPALAQRLQAQAPAGSTPWLDRWSAERAALDIATLGGTGSGSTSPSAVPRAATAANAASADEHGVGAGPSPAARNSAVPGEPDVAASTWAAIVQLLRSAEAADVAEPAGDDRGDGRRSGRSDGRSDARGNGRVGGDVRTALSALLALSQEPASHPARALLARELESPLAAQRLAAALPPEALLRVVAWLRPADAAALHALWPGLAALAAGGGSGTDAEAAWPRAARGVLRELFEEDRPLQPSGLLQRVAASLQPRPAPSLATPATHWPWEAEALAPGEPLFVANAGIVLAAPYLPRLFSMLGLVEGRSFVDAAAAERAVLLLQFAVSGLAGAAEPLLPLLKLLCGLPLYAPVDAEIVLRPAEREAVDGMLGAMISHWTALGRTSLAGLRQTFLQREGRLEHQADAWQLHVAPQTFDMLLDRLPWGYATLRFPWMPEVLHVQWR